MTVKYRKRKKNPLDLGEVDPETKVKGVSDSIKIPKTKKITEQSFEPDLKTVDSTISNLTKSKSFTYEGTRPVYASPYSEQIDRLFKELTAQPKFDYDPETDEDYLELKDVYTAQGQRAMKDTVATAAAQTGGIASSYASSAGAQAYQRYMQTLGELVPELRENAYGEYMDGIENKRKDLEALTSLEKESYNRYLDDLDAYFDEYDRAYGQYTDELERSDYLDKVEYEREKDSRDFEYKKTSDEQARADALAELEYRKEQDALDREYDYETLDYRKYQDYLDRIDAEDREAYEREQDAIDRENEAIERAWNEAFLKAEYGDYSGLDDIGVDSKAYEQSVKTEIEMTDPEARLNSLMNQCLNENLADGTTRERTEAETWVALRQLYIHSNITNAQYEDLVEKLETYFRVKRKHG